MKKRSRVWAILGAAVLTVGVVGIALAEDLKGAHQGITVGWDDNGDPFTDGFDGGPNAEECDELDLQPGDIVFHFVQSGPGTVANAAGNNLLDVWFTGADDQTDVVEDSIQGNGTNVDWFVWTSSDGSDITLDTASSNVTGGELRVSHICVGDEPEQESEEPSEEVSEEPSFEQSEEPSEEPSEEVSEEPSFEQSEAADTDAPSLPDTATIGGTNLTGSPADGAWLLVVALGVLLASIVVLTPARARNR